NLAKLNDVQAPIIWNTDTSTNASIKNAEAIFGGIAVEGKLERTVSSNFTAGSGYTTSQTRLRYSKPENAGINRAQLTKDIDAIAKEMIDKKAAPGAVVMVVK